MIEEDDHKSEISNADNRGSKSEKEQNDFNLNLIKSLKSEEIKNTMLNIFDSYYQSDKTRLKNIAKKALKRQKPLEDDLMEIDEEKKS